jgi:hypothetical protein
MSWQPQAVAVRLDNHLPLLTRGLLTLISYSHVNESPARPSNQWNFVAVWPSKP